MSCLGNDYLVKWDEEEDSVSVVPKCSCSGGSNKGNTVSFRMRNRNCTGIICAVGKF